VCEQLIDSLTSRKNSIHEKIPGSTIESDAGNPVFITDQQIAKGWIIVDLVEKKYFEDIAVGDSCISVGRTITETDIVNFAGISGDYNTIHTDAEYAKSSIAGQRLAHGLLVMVIASGLFTRTAYNLSITETLTALAEIKSWKFLKPVLIGDTIHVLVEIIEKADAKPESKSGRIIFRRSVVNQRGEVVQAGEYVSLIKKRGR